MAESAVAPPGPIPNPVVTRRSAGEYCRGDPVGGEAAAGTPRPRLQSQDPLGHERSRRQDPQASDRFDRRPIADDRRRAGVRAAGWSSGSSLGS